MIKGKRETEGRCSREKEKSSKIQAATEAKAAKETLASRTTRERERARGSGLQLQPTWICWIREMGNANQIGARMMSINEFGGNPLRSSPPNSSIRQKQKGSKMIKSNTKKREKNGNCPSVDLWVEKRKFTLLALVRC